MSLYEQYVPHSIYKQLDSNGGTFFHLVTGGCGRTSVNMEIEKRKSCTKKHYCLGVHNISIIFYSRWMGSDGTTDDKVSGKLHMISESYGIITFYKSTLLKAQSDKNPNNESVNNKTVNNEIINNKIDDNSNDVVEYDNDPEDYEMYDYKSAYILRAQLVFLSHPTPSPFEAKIKNWYGMGGQWNLKNDALLILSDEAKDFGQTIEFERVDNNVIDISMRQPMASKPMYHITFYFDNPLAMSNDVQDILINCILGGSKEFPESLNHENFVDDISVLHLFVSGWLDINKRSYATFIKSDDMLNDKFDSVSSHILMNTDLLYYRMKVCDGWLLATTSIEPTEMKLEELSSEISVKKIKVMWQNVEIGHVYVVYKVADTGKVITTLIKK